MQVSTRYEFNDRLYFHCPSCGLRLSVIHQMSGITAPCPRCGFAIRAPGIPTATIVPVAEPSRFAQVGVVEHRQDVPVITAQPPRKGRIMADLLVDQKHLEWKETTGLVRLFMYAILAISLCVLVAWLLDSWSAK